MYGTMDAGNTLHASFKGSVDLANALFGLFGISTLGTDRNSGSGTGSGENWPVPVPVLLELTGTRPVLR